MSFCGTSKRKRVDATTLTAAYTSTFTGDATCQSNLYVEGDLKVDGAASFPVVLPSKIYVDSGSDALPAYSFADEKSLGMERSGVSELSLCSGGSKRLKVDSSVVTSTLPVSIPDGAVATPSVRFTSAPTSGLYLDLGEVKTAVAGVDMFDVGSTGVLSRGTLSALGDIKTLYDVEGDRTLLLDGKVSRPSFAFVNDDTAGIYRTGTGAVAITQNSLTNPIATFYNSAASIPTLSCTTCTTSSLSCTNGTISALTCTSATTGSLVCGPIQSSSSSGLEFTTGSPNAYIYSQTADILLTPGLVDALKLTPSLVESLQNFTAPQVETKTLNATTSTSTTSNCTTVNATTANATTANCTTLVATTGTVTTLSAPTLTSTTSSLGTMSGSTLILSSQSYLELQGTVAQTITTGTDTLVTFSSTPFRTQGNGFTLEPDNGTVTIANAPTNGLYSCVITVGWDSNTTGTREVFVRRNGSYNVAWDAMNADANLVQTASAVTYVLTSGSTLQARVYQSSGADRTITNVRMYVARIW